MKKILCLFLAVAMVLSMAACGVTNSPSGSTPTPSNPNTPAEPVVNKCVIYISSLATVLEAFGKTDCIVGAYGSLATQYNVPSCGKWNEVDVEAVIATGADAVFGYKNYTTEEQIATLEAAGITCYFIELSDADTAAAEVAELGRLFACQEKAQVFVDLYNTYDALLTERLANVNKLNVYVEGTSSTPKTANNTSAAHKLVVGAGLNNLYAENETTYPERNLEDVIVKNPDVVVKLCGSSAALGADLYNEYVNGLYGVGAADGDKVILLNNECGTTAIGSIIGRLYIAKFAYPELFTDVDVDAIYERLCSEFFGKDFPGSGAYTAAPQTVEPVVNKCVIYISSLATILEAFGKTDCIVGAYGSLATQYNVPSCGKWNEVDVEAVIATGADAVFGYKNYTTEDQIAALEAAGVKCYFIELSDADTAAAEVTELGRLFACQRKANTFVRLYNTYDKLLKDRLATVTALNVYVEGTSSTPKTANNTSAAHKLVVGAGLNNLYADNATTYPERNLEDVIVKNPDVIVKLLGSSGKLDETTYNEYVAGLAGVSAADIGKVILLNNECGTTAIGSIIGRLYIAKFAYPELFADVDVDAIYEELCELFFGKEFAGSGAYFK